MIRILDCSGNREGISEKAEPTCHVQMIQILSNCVSMDQRSGDAGTQKPCRRNAEKHGEKAGMDAEPTANIVNMGHVQRQQTGSEAAVAIGGNGAVKPGA